MFLKKGFVDQKIGILWVLNEIKKSPVERWEIKDGIKIFDFCFGIKQKTF